MACLSWIDPASGLDAMDRLRNPRHLREFVILTA